MEGITMRSMILDLFSFMRTGSGSLSGGSLVKKPQTGGKIRRNKRPKNRLFCFIYCVLMFYLFSYLYFRFSYCSLFVLSF